ncbi:MAG TPA: winged helix-turn-helix domain-containing protein [Prolixibacteraceae bacterium]|nr:winged helix-turn-helix domain-containing protein [Prolixibacteraceae bacterium]
MIEVEAHIVIKRNGDTFLCPQKVKLLTEVQKQGSLNAAAKVLGISYQHAWNLITELNRTGTEPLVTKQRGGSKGGGAALTTYGERLLNDYRSIGQTVNQLIAPINIEINL